MNTENIGKSKKAKKTTKSSTKNVKKKDVKKNIKKASKKENKSTKIETNLVMNKASLNTTANQPTQNESNRKFTLDIIELLDGKVNKNIVFFGFLILVLNVVAQSAEVICKDLGYMCYCNRKFHNDDIIIILFIYWTYLMLKHRLILKSLVSLILFISFFILKGF